jgi:hypothetical protein
VAGGVPALCNATSVLTNSKLAAVSARDIRCTMSALKACSWRQNSGSARRRWTVLRLMPAWRAALVLVNPQASAATRSSSPRRFFGRPIALPPDGLALGF